ncbi:MAG: hypothetical protein NT062_36620, partial [Proteobacteria bacterium]|nr:hypothetical protein [Pseudomonadota bacterium]
MSARRVVSILGACLVSVGVGGSVAGAQPKKAPVAPAKDPAAGAPAVPPTPADPAQPVQPIDDPPPSDMNGTDENPDSPKTDGEVDQSKVVAVPVKSNKSGYPMEEVLRPITLPANMSEVSLGAHAVLGAGDSLYAGTGALRARYGITREVQLGLTYVVGGIFHEPALDPSKSDIKFKPGKAVGLDMTVLVQNWIGVKVGVPIYIDPVAVGIDLGAPIKFQFGDKLAIGGLDDLLSIKVSKFAPSFYAEDFNQAQAFLINSKTNTGTSRGALRFSAYGVYQSSPKLAILGRFGLNIEDFASNRG